MDDKYEIDKKKYFDTLKISAKKIDHIHKLQKRCLEHIRHLKDKNISALEKKINYCISCGTCCWTMPCDLEYNDIQLIADHLGWSKRELFHTKLIFQYYGKGNFVLMPIREEQEDIAGTIKTIERSFDIDSPCIFLKDNKCSINEQKPTGGTKMNCWENPNLEDTAIFWTKKEVEILINELG